VIPLLAIGGWSTVTDWAPSRSVCPKIEIRRADALTDRERTELLRLRDQLDPGPPVLGYQFAPKVWRVFVWDGDRLVSSAGVLERTVTVAGQPTRVGGIGSVGTHPSYRGRGLASAAMTAAMAFVCGELEAEHGFLLCRDHVAGFYERLGWARVTAPIVFEQPDGKVTWPLTAMVRPCRERGWPPGLVDLGGLPW
jgi:predicted GNAT family N-acyltransferase